MRLSVGAAGCVKLHQSPPSGACKKNYQVDFDIRSTFLCAEAFLRVRPQQKKTAILSFLKDGLQSFALYLRHVFGADLCAPKNSKEAGG